LLLDVSELSQRDAATGVQRVVRSYLKALLQSPPKDFRVEPVYATRDEGYRYARRFTQRFLGQNAENVTDEPVHWQRADVFFGLDMQHYAQLGRQAFFRRLQSDGVTVKFLVHDLLPIQLASSFKDSDAKELHERWLAMIAGADGAICVSKATADAFDYWITENNISRAPNFQITWVHSGADIEDSKPSMGLPPNAPEVLSAVQSRPSFLCVGTLEPRKRQDQILAAIELLWDEGLDINLVFVGQQGWKTENLVENIQRHPEKDRRLYWLQGISDEYLQKVYTASACLIAASVNEGFGLPLIEAARHGIPVVARDIPVFREVAGECAFYFAGDTPHELANSLKVWLDLDGSGSHPKSDQMRWSTWQESAEKLKNAIFQENYPRRQLLVDISELAQRDARTGIQRVVRNILKEWLNHPPEGYRVEPVYATTEKDYRYARCFTHSFLGYPSSELQDEPIDYAPGDIFLGLDLQPQVVAARREFYQVLRRQGVRVEFLVYDLLSIQTPQYFPPGTAENFTEWLKVVAESDGAVCISKTVADQLAAWVEENSAERQRPFRTNWFHIGADIADSMPAGRLPPDEYTALNCMTNRPTFLMVGTIEPRKAHAQVLQAFEALWQGRHDLDLVIVGKQGWMVERFIDRLREHPELNSRLFWLDGISDEYLDKIYAASTCLIAASEGEGLGLPLIEAAQHKLPIIARDIPVFREVAGEHAFYFKGNDPKELANAIEEWLALHDKNNHPKSDDMPRLTWKESAATSLQRLLGEDYRLNGSCSGARSLWEDSQKDRPVVEAPCMRQNASMLGDEVVNQPTIKVLQGIPILKIDIEGAKKAVLQGADFGKIRPWIILLEATLPNGQKESCSDWEPLLLNGGYEYAYFDGLNRYYVAREHENLKAAFKAPPNVFDDFVRSEQPGSERRAREAEAKVREVERRASRAEACAQKAETKARYAEVRAAKAEATLHAVYSGNSWRATRPLRWLANTVRHLRKKAKSSPWLKNVALRKTSNGLAPRQLMEQSPRAREIYFQLNGAIKKNRENK
jgi:glycosyltransferase involved in cell wall biosynthesis